MGVRHHRQFVGVRFVDHRSRFFQGHLVLVDQLDDVHSRVGELFDLGLCIGRAFDSPAIKFFSRIRLVLEKWTGDIQGRARNFAAIDSIAHAQAVGERSAEVAGAGDSGHQELVRGRGHDFGAEPFFVGLVPMSVIAVTEDHGVNVAIPESRQHIHALGRDYFRVLRDRQGTDLADRGNPFALDQDDAVRERRAAKPIDQSAADQSRQAKAS